MGKKNLLKKKKNVQSKKNDLDFYSMKSNILSELIDSYNPEPKFNERGSLIKNNSKLDYAIAYNYYISNEFNSKCVSLCVDYINQTNLKKKFKTENNFITKFIKVIKDLMMNEFELILFFLYLDKITCEKITKFSDLYFIGYATKIKANKETKIIKKKLNDLFDNFNRQYDFFIIEFGKEFEYNFDFIEINEQIKKLNKPHNNYCKQNFIDYNGVVDKILDLCQPYKGDSRGIQLKTKKIKEFNSLIDSNISKTNYAVNNSVNKTDPNEGLNLINSVNIGMNYYGDNDLADSLCTNNNSNNLLNSLNRNNISRNNSTYYIDNINNYNNNKLCNDNSIFKAFSINEIKKSENFITPQFSTFFTNKNNNLNESVTIFNQKNSLMFDKNKKDY